MKQTNGKVLGNTYEEGHKRRLQCNNGYLPLDPNNVTSQCQKGRWTNFTTCVQKCPPFENKSNGKVVGDSFIEGATRNLTCNKNYSPRNSTNVERRCENGRWSTITECVQVCPPFDEIKNGTVVGDSVFEGATRNLTCNQNYSPRNTTNVVSRCENGQWSPITECVRVCPHFVNKSNGTVVGDSVFEGATRTLSCNQHYSPRNTTHVVSRCENGQWSNITECVKVCPTIQNKSNGVVVVDSLFEGATVILSCNQNYSPRNSTNLESRCENGQWSVITECVKDCPQFIKPKNATVEGESITVGSTRTLKCDNNYKPLNESKIKSVCDNGMWSSTTRCVPEKCVYPAFEFNQSIYLFTNLSTSFDTAAEYCTGCDGHVISIDDEKEQEWVDETAPNVPDLHTFWLGIRDPNKDRHRDNSSFTRKHDQVHVSYYHWAGNQPNNNKNDQECVKVSKTIHWFWNDWSCGATYSVVCELHN